MNGKSQNVTFYTLKRSKKYLKKHVEEGVHKKMDGNINNYSFKPLLHNSRLWFEFFKNYSRI